MVKAVIQIDEKTNRVLNIIKAKYGLKDKSAAIMHMAAEYEKELMEPELRPEFIEKAQEIMKPEPTDVGTIENWKKMLSNDKTIHWSSVKKFSCRGSRFQQKIKPKF